MLGPVGVHSDFQCCRVFFRLVHGGHGQPVFRQRLDFGHLGHQVLDQGVRVTGQGQCTSHILVLEDLQCFVQQVTGGRVDVLHPLQPGGGVRFLQCCPGVGFTPPNFHTAFSRDDVVEGLVFGDATLFSHKLEQVNLYLDRRLPERDEPAVRDDIPLEVPGQANGGGLSGHQTIDCVTHQ
ncbi:hypothetical protein D3C73_1053030 [compost metagenome]